MCLGFGELRIGAAHFLHERSDKPIEKQIISAELLTVADGAANDAAQHIASALIARQHAVNDQEGASSDVIDDDVE